MTQFIEPGVKFERIPNPKYAILPGGTAEVVFIGVGKQTITQDSEAVVRGANWTPGTFVSGAAAATVTSATSYRFNINLNGDGAKLVTVAYPLNSGASIASAIQSAVRATIATDGAKSLAYSGFTCTYNATATTYTMTSGLPTWLGTDSSIVVTAEGTDTLYADLNLDTGVATAGVGNDNAPDTLASVPEVGNTVSLKYGSTTYVEGVHYTRSDDEITWIFGFGPAYGVTYYATYERPKTAAEYAFTTKYSLDEVVDAYGDELDVNNTISMAASLFFANGGVRINIVQMVPTGVGGTYVMNDYTTALNSLELEELDIIVPLLTQDNVFTSLFSVTKEHVYRMSQPDEGKNRLAFLAPKVGTTLQEYLALAPTLAIDRTILTAPASVVLDINSVETTVPAYHFNAAMAGFLANPDTIISEPLTRKELFGIKKVGAKFTKSQLRTLLTAGVLTIEDAAGITRVVHGITTDRTNVDTSEISLVRISDFFGKTLKNVLDKSFIGSRIDVTTLSSIRGTIQMVIDNFIVNGALIGAKNVSVTQDTLNPTLVHVSMTLRPVYPLNFIDVKFTLEL